MTLKIRLNSWDKLWTPTGHHEWTGLIMIHPVAADWTVDWQTNITIPRTTLPTGCNQIMTWSCSLTAGEAIRFDDHEAYYRAVAGRLRTKADLWGSGTVWWISAGQRSLGHAVTRGMWLHVTTKEKDLKNTQEWLLCSSARWNESFIMRKSIRELLKVHLRRETQTINLLKGKGNGLRVMWRRHFRATVSAFSFSWPRFLPWQMNETLPARPDKRLRCADWAVWVCLFYAWVLLWHQYHSQMSSFQWKPEEEEKEESAVLIRGCFRQRRLPDLLQLCF